MKIGPVLKRKGKGGERGLHVLSWDKSSQFVNSDSNFTYCVVAPPQSLMTSKIRFYARGPLNVPWTLGGPLGPQLGTAALKTSSTANTRHVIQFVARDGMRTLHPPPSLLPKQEICSYAQ